MKDDDRIDLTPLEPSPARWQAMLASVTARASARPPSLAQQLAAWARPALAVAAMLVVVVWAATLLRGQPKPAARQSDGVYQIVGWARSGQLPDVEHVLEVLEVNDAQ